MNLRYVILLIIIFKLTVLKTYGDDKPINLTDRGQPVATIVCVDNFTTYALISNRIVQYVKEQTTVKLPVSANNQAKPSVKTVTILLDGTPEKSLLAKYGFKTDVQSDRADAYVLKAFWQNGNPFIILAGNTANGVKFAAYRLLEELTIDHRNASLRPINIKAEPYFKTRIISIGNIWRTAVDIERKYNVEAWPVDRIKKSVDMYDGFGFNGFEVLDRFNDGYLVPCYGITRKDWRNKVWTIADEAHANGQKLFLRAWGNAVMDIPDAFKVNATASVPRIFKTFCPDLPDDRKRWENEIRDYFVPNYASHIDNFIGHWSDAGGCRDPLSKATVKDAMLLHMELEQAFKKVNPKVETSFSLWHMDGKNWRGYKDYRSLSEAGVLDKDVILAQATRATSHMYSDAMTKNFKANGYRPAVWTWIQGDSESFHDDAALLIRVHSLSRYFKALPPSARDLEWTNIERCQHGMGNVVNYYVAGKLMWDPQANPDTLLKDFAVKMFGSQNAPYIIMAYNAMEKLRISDNTNKEPSPANPEQLAVLSQQALSAIKKVCIDPAYHPRLLVDISPQQIADDLLNALVVITDYYQCYGNELTVLDKAAKAGNKQLAEQQVATLKTKINNWDKSIAGLFEARAMERELQRRGYLAKNTD